MALACYHLELIWVLGESCVALACHHLELIRRLLFGENFEPGGSPFGDFCSIRSAKFRFAKSCVRAMARVQISKRDARWTDLLSDCSGGLAPPSPPSNRGPGAGSEAGSGPEIRNFSWKSRGPLRTDRGRTAPAAPPPRAGNSQPVGRACAPPHSNKVEGSWKAGEMMESGSRKAGMLNMGQLRSSQ